MISGAFIVASLSSYAGHFGAGEVEIEAARPEALQWAIERGSHAELLARNGTYRKLWNDQIHQPHGAAAQADDDSDEDDDEDDLDEDDEDDDEYADRWADDDSGDDWAATR